MRSVPVPEPMESTSHEGIDTEWIRPSGTEAGTAYVQKRRLTFPTSWYVRRRSQVRTQRWRPPRYFALPVAAAIGVLYTIPNLLQFAAAFTDWSTYKTGISFVGFENFSTLTRSGVLGNAVRVSLTFALVVMVLENAVTLMLALALKETNAINNVFRAVFFLPVLVSALAAGHASRAIFASDGFLNHLLSTAVGWFGGDPIQFSWLGSTTWTILVVAAVHAWKFGGIHMMIYIAGLNAIPPEIVQAARVDGASRWLMFRRIYLPLLAPAITVNITLTLIGSLSAFDVIMATTAGGPARSTEIFNMIVFREWGTGLFGSATAISLTLVLAIVALAVPLITYLRAREVSL